DGWRGVFALFALPGLAWAVWFYWWFRNRPQEHPRVNPAELSLLQQEQPTTKEEAPSRVPGLLILTSVPLLLPFTEQAPRAGANRVFDSRLPTYFEEERLQDRPRELRGLAAARAAELWAAGAGHDATTQAVVALHAHRAVTATEELEQARADAKADAGTLASL